MFQLTEVTQQSGGGVCFFCDRVPCRNSNAYVRARWIIVLAFGCAGGKEVNVRATATEADGIDPLVGMCARADAS
jgi:hypothetical protein